MVSRAMSAMLGPVCRTGGAAARAPGSSRAKARAKASACARARWDPRQ